MFSNEERAKRRREHKETLCARWNALCEEYKAFIEQHPEFKEYARLSHAVERAFNDYMNYRV